MPTDFSDYTGLIPQGTVAVLQAHVRYGDGTDGVLKRTKNGDAEGLDLELTVLEGQYAKQKLFWFALVVGTTDGQKSMAEKNLATLKRVIDSAKFLDPNDRSPEARKARNLEWRDFDGVRFLAEIGVEEGRDGYPNKNIVAKVVTRDMPAWGQRPPIDQVASDFGSSGPTASGAPQAEKAEKAANVAPIKKPSWAS
jgi:hypothetical protein